MLALELLGLPDAGDADIDADHTRPRPEQRKRSTPPPTYVHTIAHQLGPLYHLPHGYLNAILLPYVLDLYVDGAAPRMAQLARACGLGRDGEDPRSLAMNLVVAIRQLNACVGILPTLLIEVFPRCLPTEKIAFFKDLGRGPEFSKLPFDQMIFTGSSGVGRAVMASAAADLSAP